MCLPGATYFIRNNQFRGRDGGGRRSGGGSGSSGSGDVHFGWPIYIDTDRF